MTEGDVVEASGRYRAWDFVRLQYRFNVPVVLVAATLVVGLVAYYEAARGRPLAFDAVDLAFPLVIVAWALGRPWLVARRTIARLGVEGVVNFRFTPTGYKIDAAPGGSHGSWASVHRVQPRAESLDLRISPYVRVTFPRRFFSGDDFKRVCEWAEKGR